MSIHHQVFTYADVNRYQFLALAIALELYSRTHRAVSLAYTPKAMIHTASRLTGRSFKPRDYIGAANVLRNLAS